MEKKYFSFLRGQCLDARMRIFPDQNKPYVFSFFRIGGCDQVLLRSGEDLFHLKELDHTLWVASSCPTQGLNLEKATLDLLDQDGDGRIRPADILATIDWLDELVADRDIMVQGGDSFVLGKLRTDTPRGKALREAAEKDLIRPGKVSPEKITLEEVEQIRREAPEKSVWMDWERLLRMQRDFFLLANNFVAMPDFYRSDRAAIFQMGSLIMDGCELWMCVKVHQVEKHLELASEGGIFLIYCEARRHEVEQPLLLCAAVTSRRAGRFIVGKNGLYYDRHGREWDARVIRVVVNPISLREAVWAPFRRIGEAMGKTLEKLTTSRQNAVEGQLDESVLSTQNRGPGSPHSPPTGGSNHHFGWMLAGGGVALAALSSSVAYLARTIYATEWQHLIYAILLILFFLVGPSTLLGFLRLRARDLAMILEASGWAINRPMRINGVISRHLTREGRVPLSSPRIPWVLIAETRRHRWRRIWMVVLATALIATLLGSFLYWRG